MSEKLINNPLDELNEAPKKPKRKKKERRFNFTEFFFGKEIFLPPCLLIVAMLMLILFKIAIGFFPDKTGGYLGVVILLTVIFFIPAYLFYKFTRHGKMSMIARELKIKLPSVRHFFLMLFGAVLISIVIFFVNLLFRLRSGYSDGFYLYNSFFTERLPLPDTPFFPIVAFALIPALCEEFMFRGIFHASYEKQGYLAAGITTSLMYALISLDWRTFVSHLILGLFLTFVLYLTDSLLACAVINFLTKCFMLFFGTNLQSYVLSTSNRAVFIAVMIGGLLLSIAVFAFECAKVFRKSAKGEYTLPSIIITTPGDGVRAMLSNVSSFSMIVCVIFFIVALFIK